MTRKTLEEIVSRIHVDGSMSLADISSRQN